MLQFVIMKTGQFLLFIRKQRKCSANLKCIGGRAAQLFLKKLDEGKICLKTTTT